MTQQPTDAEIATPSSPSNDASAATQAGTIRGTPRPIVGKWMARTLLAGVVCILAGGAVVWFYPTLLSITWPPSWLSSQSAVSRTISPAKETTKKNPDLQADYVALQARQSDTEDSLKRALARLEAAETQIHEMMQQRADSHSPTHEPTREPTHEPTRENEELLAALSTRLQALEEKRTRSSQDSPTDGTRKETHEDKRELLARISLWSMNVLTLRHAFRDGNSMEQYLQALQAIETTTILATHQRSAKALITRLQTLAQRGFQSPAQLVLTFEALGPHTLPWDRLGQNQVGQNQVGQNQVGQNQVKENQPESSMVQSEPAPDTAVDVGWWQRTLDRFDTIIRIEKRTRDDSQFLEDDPREVLIVRIHQPLTEGNLAGAIEIMQVLERHLDSRWQRWMAELKKTAEAQDIINALQAIGTKRLIQINELVLNTETADR